MQTSFDKADLRGADLSNSDLTGADFTGANTDGLRLDGADLQGPRGLSVTTAENSPDRLLRGIHANTLPDSLASVRESSSTSTRTSAANPVAAASPGADTGPAF
nr:pentapeptide repeat-containing protein [Corynebacterium sp. CNJ-954]